MFPEEDKNGDGYDAYNDDDDDDDDGDDDGDDDDDDDDDEGDFFICKSELKVGMWAAQKKSDVEGISEEVQNTKLQSDQQKINYLWKLITSIATGKT